MQKIADITERLTSTISQQPSAQQPLTLGKTNEVLLAPNVSQQVSARDVKIGKEVFSLFRQIYGHLFLSLYPIQEMQNKFAMEWGYALRDISEFQILKAFNRLRDPHGEFSGRIPTIMQFKALGLPSEHELNIPSMEEVFRDLFANYRQTHPFVCLITKQLDMNMIRQLPEKDAFYRVKPVYELARKQALREGKVLPKLKTYIDPVPSRTLSKQEVEVIEEEERKAREAHFNRCCELLGRPKKYATVLEYREKLMNAVNDFKEQR